ncbi:MAG: ABC transporter permease [Planctomycetes bacterium]|nr:ABC transporter permease [Planctomycetota bacterium]
MTTALLNFARRFLSLSWLTGPIFEKELRVSSRRRRNYVLRFTYLALLTIFLVLTWLVYVPRGGTGLYQISRMAEAGKGITAYIVWFQFIAIQIVGVIMLSTSISDEIYNRTLGLLMTTPINSFQIVTGKLFSKLLQLLLLLAISLPLLAIVRVFGGVPWIYVISSLCITVTAVVFVGLLSLFFSIFSRRAYVVIILTTLTLGAIFLLLPFLAAYMLHRVMSQGTFFSILTFPNPYFTFFFNTMLMMEPRAMMGRFAFYWPVHCGVMLGASGLLLFLSVLLVRRVALRQATGQLGVSARKRRTDKEALPSSSERRDFAPAPRRVKGPPVLWKELRSSVLGRRKIAVLITIAVGLIILLVTYALCADERMLNDDETHIVYVVIFIALGMLFTVILPATCITSEKEARSWHLLLTTTLSDWQILFGKFAGILRRCLPIWCLLFGHIIVFTLAGIIHPIASVQMGILVAWIVVFLSGTGLYFSSRFKRTTTAVIMNFALAATVWALLPLLIALVAAITRDWHDFFQVFMDVNPFVHAVSIMDATTKRGRLGTYYWIGPGSLPFWESMLWMLVCMLGYMFLGLLFAWRAKCRMRRNIF